MNNCYHPNCKNPIHTKWLCEEHQEAHFDWPLCAVCDTGPVKGRGLCITHYNRLFTNTDLYAPIVRRTRKERPCSVDECSNPYRSKGYCQYHYDRYIKGLPVEPTLDIDDPLTWPVQTYKGYRYRQTQVGGVRRFIAEHHVIMERILGRKLLKHENVHHKNGQRGDNRPENLELWSTSQPSGQRVEDKTAWAVEWLREYAPECLA